DGVGEDGEAPLELVLGELPVLKVLTDEHLAVRRLGRLDRLAERRIVGRYRAPAEQPEALGCDHLRVDVGNLLLPLRLVRQEQRADRVLARPREGETELGGLLGEELMRDLGQDAGAIAGA